jgi:bifunctional non-homologous end joining protein LigD
MNAEQLPLSLGEPRSTRLPARLAPMQPADAAAPFDDEAFLFEPWWPGLRALAFVDGGAVRLLVEGVTDATHAFPELADELPRQVMADGLVIDGTLMTLDTAGGIDPGPLRTRLGGDRRPGRPAFVASDLLWSDGRPVVRRRFVARHERLRSVLRDGDRCVVGRALRREGTLLAEALGPMGIGALSARRLDARYRAGQAGEAWLRIPIVASAVSERPQLALIQRLPLPAD